MVAPVKTKDVEKDKRKVLLSITDLHVWFELRRFGFSNAGHVKAVDGVTFDVHQGRQSLLSAKADAENRA